MCVLCNEFTPTTPSHLPVDDQGISGANITEIADAAASVATGYSMSVGDTFSGNLSSAGDRDWVAITLTAGQSIDIDLTGSPSGHGTLSDPYLRLYNSTGTLIALNDDGGVGYESSMTYTATTGGTYYIAAGSYGDNYTGTYRITVSEDEPAPVADLDTLADYLTDGYWQDNGSSGRAFDTSASNQITVNLTGLTAAGQQLARWALEAWEMVADLDFVETTSTGADIMFQDHASGAYSTSSVSFGTINSSVVNVSTNWITTYGTTLDSYSFQTYVHEIGHALGLGHQGAYNGAATYGTDETYANDSWQLSIMSYFSQTDNTTVTASYATLLSAMMADIVAIQTLYGAPGTSSATDGATIWGTGTNLGGYYADLIDTTSGAYAGGPVAYTIYDRGGVDRIDTTGLTGNQRVDLNDEAFSDIGGLTGNVGIARGTVIENAFTGAGNDTITGNEAGNDIRAGAGHDSITGNAGADTLDGGTGNDTMTGGSGADVFVMTAGADRITDFSTTGDRINLIGRTTITSYADLTASHMSQVGANVVINDGVGGTLTLLGVSLASLDEGDFILTNSGPIPTAGNDTLTGTTGNDTLDGLAGNDNIQGLAGNDNLRGSDGHDLLLGADGNDTLGGGNGNDRIYGGNHADVIFGALGNDVVGGGNGNDRIYGGGNSDTLYGGNGDDQIGGGNGIDRLAGNAGNDTLFANAGDDVLNASTGNDALYGGIGNDQLNGGDQNDRLLGGVGNDTLAGGDHSDTLYGGNDNDRLFGGDGYDQLFGGNGNDTLTGGNGNDTLNGSAGDDRLIGGGLNDTFIYTGGIDVIVDFDQDGNDRIDLSRIASITSFADLQANHMSASGGDVIINAFGGNTLTLQGVSLASLDAGDFIF